MTVQQLAPWVSLLVTAFTFVYVVVREWQQYGESTPDSGRSLAQFLARLDTFVYTVVPVLFVAGLVHYALTFTSVSVLAIPVWMLAVFVVVATGATQAMPGEDFEDKLERADEELKAESDATAADGDATAADGDGAADEPARPRDSRDNIDE